MVVQLVEVAIKPEARDRWLELVGSNATETRAEDGCLGVQVSEDIESPNTFVLVERWEDMEAQHDHFRNPRFGELMQALGDVLAGPPEISIHEVASTMAFDEVLAAAGVELG